jgi:hypothetical protein
MIKRVKSLPSSSSLPPVRAKRAKAKKEDKGKKGKVIHAERGDGKVTRITVQFPVPPTPANRSLSRKKLKESFLANRDALAVVIEALGGARNESKTWLYFNAVLVRESANKMEEGSDDRRLAQMAVEAGNALRAVARIAAAEDEGGTYVSLCLTASGTVGAWVARQASPSFKAAIEAKNRSLASDAERAAAEVVASMKEETAKAA